MACCARRVRWQRKRAFNPGLVIGTTIQLLRAVDEPTDSILRLGAVSGKKLTRTMEQEYDRMPGGEASAALTLVGARSLKATDDCFQTLRVVDHSPIVRALAC